MSSSCNINIFEPVVLGEPSTSIEKYIGFYDELVSIYDTADFNCLNNEYYIPFEGSN